MKGSKVLWVTAVVLVVLGFIQIALGAEGDYWRAARQIPIGPGQYAQGHNPCIVTTGNGNVVYLAYVRTDGSIVFRRSTDNAITWGAVQIIDTGTTGGVALVAIGQVVHVVYLINTGSYYSVYDRRSTDGGITFQNAVSLTYSAYSQAGAVSAARHSNGIVVAWNNKGYPTSQNILCRLWSLSNNTWDPPLTSEARTITTLSALNYYGPRVAAGPSGQNQYVVWGDNRDGIQFDVYGRHSNDGGQTWLPSGDENLTGTSSLSGDPVVVVTNDNRAYLVFDDNQVDPIKNPNGYQLARCKIYGTGGSFYTITPNPPSMWGQYIHDVTTDTIHAAGDTLQLVWREASNADYIYYDRSANESGWVNLGTRGWAVSGGLGVGGTPTSAIATNFVSGGVNSGTRHVVWLDNSYNLYYRKMALDRTAPSAPTNLQAILLCDLPPCVYLWWNPPGDPDLACFNIYRQVGPQPWAKLDSFITSTYYSDYHNISCNQPYTCYYVKAMDYAENEGPQSNTACVGSNPAGPASVVQVGLPTPSPQTVQRAAFTSWGNGPLQRADLHPNRLIYSFNSLDTSRVYLISLVYSRLPSDTSERSVSADVNGIPLHPTLSAPESPSPFVFRVPKQAYQNGDLVLNLNKVAGPNVAVCRIALWMLPKGWGGPQSYEGASRIPSQTELGPAKPNPASSSVSWAYSLSQPGLVSLKLYDASGRLIRALVDEERSLGSYTATWDGKNSAEKIVPAGVYFLRMQAGDCHACRSVTIVR